ncbi:NAD-dependent epimerase/dehydratase family protein [Pseudoroseicyclus tamaricis]|uniref:NAD(P)-dependent oxidoreductase n=1 Tax=Pseudoroseicyclus tamaricis TaxID=2705421 RepID=A0A6B2JLI8_9RHOB|nr:NAD(P)-dependent oxidoreductase [Pseudoroseicyclus tamaricis]NDU99476.1 NAD(P)-dependent oxidoreductase [Pseudoroseicyclus tamaricis]
MLILLTGAGGFLGRATRAAAEARGHDIRPLTRAEGDLAEGLPPGALDGVDAVIHCAAAMDSARAARDTVQATLSLLRAMEGHPARLVLAGSIGVHGGVQGGGPALVEEETPLEPDPRGRDAYSRAKIAQEGMVRAEAAASGRAATILRLGALWDETHLSNAHLGLAAGPILLRLGGRGEVPLLHVADAAEALVRAAEREAPGLRLYTAVGDDLPDRAACIRALRRATGWPRLALPLPWRLLDEAAPLLARIPRLGPRLPGLLRRATLRARFAPARYANARLKETGWRPKHGVGDR